MGLREKGWWSGIVERLRLEPLAVLAKEVGVAPEKLAAALAEVGADGPAQLAPWWPEAKRLLKTMSVREIARRFHTNPRRVRRAAARTGVRVGGREVSPRGLLDLLPYREQLGRVPDWRIAKAAQVSVEAVQGERRRHKIPAYRPPIGYKPGVLTADEEAWILGPVKPRRERVRSDAAKVNIVRRPGSRNEEEVRPVEAPRPEPAPVAAAPERRGERRVVRPPVVKPEITRVPPARPEPTRAEVARTEAPRADSLRGGRAPVPDSFFQERERRNVDELLAVPKRPRDGRQRIVRVDAPPELPVRPPEPVAAPKKIRGRKEQGWRKVDDAVVAALEEAVAHEIPASPPPAPPPPVRPAVRTRVPVASPAPVVAPPSVSAVGAASVRWRVQSDAAVFFLQARDLMDVARQLSGLLPPDQLNRASLVRV